MLLGSIFLLVQGAGRWSLDQQLSSSSGSPAAAAR
jgi:uncharacterized membrane protein YphA (DoxX/SURF4 family)